MTEHDSKWSLYCKEEPEERHWKCILDTEVDRADAIDKGAMFVTWMSFSEPYNGNGQPEPVRRGFFPFDVDCKASPQKALDDVRSLCLVHLHDFYGVDPYAIRYFITGSKGFHAEIPAELFGAQDGDPYLPLIYKRIASDWAVRFALETSDLSLFCMGKGKMWRIPNVRRSNGHYKVPLELEELRDLSMAELWELSKSPRQIEPVDVDLVPNEDLVALYQEARKAVYAELNEHKDHKPLSDNERARIESQIPPCIKYILANKPLKSDRINFNRLTMITIDYFHTARLDETTAWDKSKDFVLGYKDSESYSTPEKRTQHWKTEWKYLQDRTGYGFSCSYVLGLRLPGSAFECTKCPVKNPSDLTNGNNPDPVRFDIVVTPRIDCELIPGAVGVFAKALAEAIQVPQELTIANTIGELSVCVARKFVIEVKPGYREPLNLYTLCPLDPGERKSATLAKCTKPLEAWEQIKAAEMKSAIDEAKSNRKTFEKIIEKKRTDAAKAKNTEDRQRIMKEIQELDQEMPEVPGVPRLLADDVTPEGAAPLMAENDERLGILSAEGGIFDILAGRYSNGVPNLDLFLKAHSGDSVRIDRKSGVPIILSNPALTMCLSPQPDVVRGLASKPGFRGRGLLGRFLYFIPQSLLGHRRIDVGTIPQDIETGYATTIKALLDYPWAENLYGEHIPHVLKLSTEAYRAWAEFWNVVEQEMRDEGRFANIRDWAGKLPGAAARLGGLFHIARHAEKAQIPLLVEIQDMNAALDMATCLSVHAQAAFGMMGADAEIETAKHILAWLKRYKHESFTARDCHRALSGRYRKLSEISPGLDILIERGFIAPIYGDIKTTVGRPVSMQYQVNPKTHE